MKKFLKWLALTIVGLIAVAIILRLTVFDLVGGGGEDTWPSVGSGSWLVVNRRATIERGDLVVFERGGKYGVRRVIALPGESVTVVDGHPVVDGRKATVEELRTVTIEHRPYRVLRETLGGKSWTVLDDTIRTMTAYPEKKVDGYFLMSDNREHGEDSRHFGALPRGSIRGVVQWRVTNGSFPY